MKRINQVVKYGAGASLMSLAVAAHAAIPAGVTEKIEEMSHIVSVEEIQDMVEVAIASVEAVLDWRAYLEEQAKSEK